MMGGGGGGMRATRSLRGAVRQMAAAGRLRLPLCAIPMALAATACGDARGGDPSVAEAAAFPVAMEDYAGSEACAGCHQEQFASWARSTHGRAGGEAGPETVIAPFDGTPIVFRDAVVFPLVDSAGRHRFVVRQEGREEVAIAVDGVIGGGHMLGGGTQGFVTRLPDGTVRFLPFDYSRQLGRWFCNTGSRTDEGWVPVTAEMALADCGDWPPARTLGTLSRFANCQSCHGSQITARLDPGQGIETRFHGLEINCESCHGPARRHIELMAAAGVPSPASGPSSPEIRPPASGSAASPATAATSPAIPSPASLPPDIGLASRVNDDVESSLQVCFQCHALKDVVREGYLAGASSTGRPGAALSDHYALALPVLGDDPWLPDGRVRTFAYQGNHLSSSCYVNGAMSCVNCHEPHGLGYWDINRAPLSSETDDRQCTSCHASKAAAPETHTFHPAGSPGSRCVACHMPYLQHPEVGDQVPFARSDHTIPVPRPQLDGRLGLVSACRGCHSDRSELRLGGQVADWWGETKPLDRVSAGMLAATEGMGAGQAARMLLHPDEPGNFDRFRGLARFLAGWVGVGGGLEAEAAARIRRMAAANDPDLRALARATLQVADSVGELPAAGNGNAASELAVRRRQVMILGFLSDEAAARGEAAEAEALLRRALRVLPGDAAALRALGLLLNQTGDHDGAIEALSASLAADSLQPLVHVNLGIARAASGDPAGAIGQYQAAIALNPAEPLAWFNLGNIYMRNRDPGSAARYYREAARLGPGLGGVHRNLALALAQTGAVEEALPHARRAAEFLPDDASIRDLLTQLEAEAQRR